MPEELGQDFSDVLLAELAKRVRELRGIIIEETEPAGGVRGATPVDAARNVLRAGIERLMQDAIRFHEEAAEAQPQPQSIGSSSRPVEPNHSATRITTGAGKSETTRGAVADYVREAKKRGIPHRVAIFVPTHKLGEEARKRFSDDIGTALLQSRRRTTLQPASRFVEFGCRRSRRGNRATCSAACRKGRRGGDPILGPFYETCGYQGRRRPRSRRTPRSPRISICSGRRGADQGCRRRRHRRKLLAVRPVVRQARGRWARRRTAGVSGAGSQRRQNSDDTHHLADLIERLKSAVKASP